MDVHTGDMLYVAAGTVHTIGGGMVLVETQQTSDITYRLYDYGRPRELHIAEGLAATKLHTNAGKVVRDNERGYQDSGALAILRSREDAAARSFACRGHAGFAARRWSRVTGSGIVESQGMEPISFATGDAVVVPASVREYTVRPQWELEIMRMSLPTGVVAEPETVLPQSASAP